MWIAGDGQGVGAARRFQPPLDDLPNFLLSAMTNTSIPALTTPADDPDQSALVCAGAYDSDRLVFGSLTGALCSSLSAILVLGLALICMTCAAAACARFFRPVIDALILKVLVFKSHCFARGLHLCRKILISGLNCQLYVNFR